MEQEELKKDLDTKNTLYLDIKALLAEMDVHEANTLAVTLDCESGELDLSFLKLDNEA